MYRRHLSSQVSQGLRDIPVVLVSGARQVGKSTFVQSMISDDWKADYVSLDRVDTLRLAQQDPQGFIRDLGRPVIIDEIQRAPELFLPIKEAVDNDRTPGGYLLTGSSNVLMHPRLADSLAGRMWLYRMYPLSVSEIVGAAPDPNLIDMLFDGKITGAGVDHVGMTKADFAPILDRGGFPALIDKDDDWRDRWYSSFIDSVLFKDTMDIRDVANPNDLHVLLMMLATRVGSTINYTDLARDLKLSAATVTRYVDLLEQLFLIIRVLPWSTNIGKRLVKSPKIYFGDTGLLCHLLNWRYTPEKMNDPLYGPILENFVLLELLRTGTWSKTKPKVYFYREHGSNALEVDFVLEARGGRIAAIEVKASSTADPKNLVAFLDRVGDKAVGGYQFYLHQRAIPIGKKARALPVSTLWKPDGD